MQHCEKCNHDARLLDGVSDVARVDYYRCPVCGEVWTAPKEGDESEPTEYDTTAELGFA
jgi:ssDNA-binding Zn-finger/Zn-ribbon topoisomerase 1